MGNSAAPACLDTVQEIAGLLREQLCIPATPPRVFIYNSDWTIPKTTDMFLVVGVLTGDPFGQGQGYKPMMRALTCLDEGRGDRLDCSS